MNKNATKQTRYYSLQVDEEKKEASINIYGDITSWEFFDNDVSSYTLSKEVEALEVDTINVYINSYGGEVGEGLAIYNTLKRHKAKVRTVCDGFACSIASVIFMAGDERIMPSTSMLFIHNPWTVASGDANLFRKQADDLEKIGQASISAYMEHANITEDELKKLLDEETWLTSQEAYDIGFATGIVNVTSKNPNQSVKQKLVEIIKHQRQNMSREPQEHQDEVPGVLKFIEKLI